MVSLSLMQHSGEVPELDHDYNTGVYKQKCYLEINIIPQIDGNFHNNKELGQEVSLSIRNYLHL